ncbi:MAG: hypothetical protein QOD82_856, partial [Pseudonocardiales bacterium]|nr:hypothetical protein [Pseudonocardiales bacterium]
DLRRYRLPAARGMVGAWRDWVR